MGESRQGTVCDGQTEVRVFPSPSSHGGKRERRGMIRDVRQWKAEINGAS